MLILWSAAILWIYFGNIINFHQHQIWGKQLIPVAATSSRPKEKSFVKFHQLSSKLVPVIKETGFNVYSASIPDPVILQPSCRFSYQLSVSIPASPPLLGDRPLRAPPFFS